MLAPAFFCHMNGTRGNRARTNAADLEKMLVLLPEPARPAVAPSPQSLMPSTRARVVAWQVGATGVGAVEAAEATWSVRSRRPVPPRWSSPLPRQQAKQPLHCRGCLVDEVVGTVSSIRQRRAVE